MWRALDLARRSGHAPAPNPRVGCVIVDQNGQWLGEGWHKRAGEAHAEVQALASVPDARRHAIRGATFYVTLEPCAHHGRTPPCADRLIAEGAARVVVATSDPFPAVNGSGIDRLRAAGLQVDVGLLQREAQSMNERFWVNTLERRPWVTLKWAESADGFMDPRSERGRIAGSGGVPITGPMSALLNHMLRAQHHSILVGRKTAEVDEPQLTNRLAPGDSPQKWVVDSARKMDANHPFYTSGGISIEEIHSDAFQSLFLEKGVHSIIVEGGAETLRRWIHTMPFDEVLVLKSPHSFGAGLEAPSLPQGWKTTRRLRLLTDFAEWLRNSSKQPSHSVLNLGH